MTALEKTMARVLETTVDCLEDVASGKGGWAWEEVLNEAREKLAEYERQLEQETLKQATEQDQSKRIYL